MVIKDYIYMYIYIQGLQGMECHTVIHKNRMRFITKLGGVWFVFLNNHF